MAEEQVQTNTTLMAFLDFEVYNDKTCSETCLKNYETLKKQCDDLIVKLNQTGFTAATYKRGLATVEEQLITYRKNEVLFSEEVAGLKREVACKDYEINMLKSEFEKVKQEKEGIEFKIEKFDNGSKSLNKLLESQITDKIKKGLGYNVVPPSHPLIYNRGKNLDFLILVLMNSKTLNSKVMVLRGGKQESNIVCDKKADACKENSDDSLVKEQVLEDTSSFVESSLNVDKETVVHKELGDRMEKAVTTASSLEAEQDIDGEVEITTTIDGQLKTITEASLRRHLKLEDADGISSLPNSEIFEQLALMGCLLFKERMNKGNGWWRNWLFNMKEHFNIMRRQEHLPERV
ncbi:hypothetical protein Tco_0450363 [Tanacetum coccineum]